MSSAGMIEGSLRNLPLTDVFQLLATSQKSGMLRLSRGRSRAQVHFEHGRVRHAQLSPDVELAEILVRMEVIEVGSLFELLELLPSSGSNGDIGRMALEAGFLGAEELQAALERQVSEVLAQLLTWRSGSFSFGEATWQPTLAEQCDFDAMILLMEVAQRSTDSVHPVAPEVVLHQIGDPTRAQIPPNGWELLAAVDGRRTAASVAAEVDMAEDQAYRLLGLLRESGVVEPSPFQVDPPAVLLVSPSPVHARILRLLLLRTRTLPQHVTDGSGALAQLDRTRPRAVVVDDHDGSGWQLTREIRALRGMAHLPVLLLQGEQPGAGVLSRLRRPKAVTLRRPFNEVAFGEVVMRMVGAPA